ncbi:MAG: C-factor, partial [Bdellovibrionales bacterium]
MSDLSSFGNRPLNVVVIGASGGIGNAFVQQFLGHPSIENLYTYSRAPIVIEQSKGYWQALDFSDEASIARAAEQASQ